MTTTKYIIAYYMILIYRNGPLYVQFKIQEMNVRSSQGTFIVHSIRLQTSPASAPIPSST